MSTDTVLKMIIAGFVFGVWPILMNKSGLNGPTSNTVFAIIVLLIILPTGIHNGLLFSGSKWWLGVLAGVLAGFGLLIFGKEVSLATKETIGPLFVIMLIVQISVPAIYDLFINGINFKKSIGFGFAIIAAILLS